MTHISQSAAARISEVILSRIVFIRLSRYDCYMSNQSNQSDQSDQNQQAQSTLRTRRHHGDTDAPPEIATLRLHAWGELGDTLAHFEDGVINVFGGIPGERVKARIIRYRRRRRQHTSAVVSEVLDSSPYRITAPCPYFGACTGCQWQHIAYDYQLELKRNRVVEALAQHTELAGISVSPTLPSPKIFGYRNHARFTIRDSGMLGFINRLTRRFVRVEDCALMHPWINQALRTLQGKAVETTQLSVRYGVNTGDWLIQPTMHNPDISLPTGQTHYWEQMHDRKLRIASPSFAQVNTPQAERLADLVGERLQLSGSELLVDAYAGVGTFAVLLADSARRVIAIEESSAAVDDAAVNIEGIENLEFVCSRTEDYLDSLEEPPDAVILDPPRVGCHPATLDALIRRKPKRTVYVSCDPDTLARDLSRLAAGGFSVTSVEPMDMFPQTYHTECVATLVPSDSPGLATEH